MDTTTVELAEGQEWRFDVPFKLILTLKVVQGIAEIFGTELPTNQEVKFTGTKACVFSPIGQVTLEYTTTANKEQSNITNEPDTVSEYVSNESLMSQIFNVHFLLEKKRQECDDSKTFNANASTSGPKVLILGGKFSGKSTVSKILCCYASKMDRVPILVNVNPRDGVFSLPGSLSAVPITEPFDVESCGGYGNTPTTSGILLSSPKLPIVKNYGYDDVSLNPDFYKLQVSKLAATTLQKLGNDGSGIIVDTPASLDLSQVDHLIDAFKIDTVVVIGNEKLSLDLKKQYPSITIMKINKSEGCVDLDDAYIRKVQEETIKQYFNGNIKNVLSPFKTEINISDIKVYKSIDAISDLFAPSLDSFELENADKNKFFELISDFENNNLENLILVVSSAPAGSELDAVVDADVLGYIHVSKVENLKGKLRVLLPIPGALPKNCLVATKIGYTE